MTDDEITSHVARIAEAMPALSADADRLRRSFVIDRIWREGELYTALSVRVDAPQFHDSYQHPGQYTTLQCGKLEPKFVVIANGPGHHSRTHWEFLIDDHTDLGETVAGLEEGDEVVLSPAEGKGYPAARAHDRNVLFFTTGSGVASVRPVLQYWADHPTVAPQNIAVYYGENRPADFAYISEFADWRSRGIRIFQAIENPADAREYRYVQHAFEDHDPKLENTFVFISGASVMMEAVVERLIRLGVDGEHIFTNI